MTIAVGAETVGAETEPVVPNVAISKTAEVRVKLTSEVKDASLDEAISISNNKGTTENESSGECAELAKILLWCQNPLLETISRRKPVLELRSLWLRTDLIQFQTAAKIAIAVSLIGTFVVLEIVVFKKTSFLESFNVS